MHILVTNDDGIHAPGLFALTQAVQSFGKVSILAPDRNWSASGHVKTMDRPLRVKEVVLADQFPALACDGAPSDCVALAILGLIAEPIDLVISGINTGANVGHDLTYSGTVTAAMEAAISGVKGIAISLDVSSSVQGSIDFSPAAEVACAVVTNVIKNGLPNGVFLNVNVPYLPGDQIKGIQVTRQGMRIYRDQLVHRLDPRGRSYYWIGGEAPTGVPDPGTDFGALAAGFVSVSPVQLDLTAHAALAPLNQWTW